MKGRGGETREGKMNQNRLSLDSLLSMTVSLSPPTSLLPCTYPGKHGTGIAGAAVIARHDIPPTRTRPAPRPVAHPWGTARAIGKQGGREAGVVVGEQGPAVHGPRVVHRVLHQVYARLLRGWGGG